MKFNPLAYWLSAMMFGIAAFFIAYGLKSAGLNGEAPGLLAVAVAMFGVGIIISKGSWI